MPKNKKPRKKKNAFSGKRQRTGNVKKLAKFNEQIEQLYQQGNIQAALNLSQQALTNFPNNSSLLSNAGIFSSTMGDSVLAVKYFQRNVEVNTNHANGHYFLAKELSLQGDFQEAIVPYKKALQLEPNHIRACVELALALRKQKQYTKAKHYYLHALALQPNFADAHNGLATLFMNMNNFKAAHKHYKIALKINPSHPYSAPKLSSLLLKTGGWTEGWKYYESRYTAQHSETKNVVMPNISTIMWQGDDLVGKFILVFHEQGFREPLQINVKANDEQ